MRPGFSQCAILQCDTTRIGQDAPCGAMPKLIHPSIPGPWHAPPLASWKTWQVLGRQGGTWAGRCTWPKREGSKRGLVESSRVGSSRVWLTNKSVQRQCQPDHDFFFSHRCTLKWVRNSQHVSTDEGLGEHRPSASPGRIAGLSNQATRPPGTKHSGTRLVIGSFPLSIWAARYISQGDTPTLHVSAPRHAQHIHSSISQDCTMSHNNIYNPSPYRVAGRGPGRPSISRPL